VFGGGGVPAVGHVIVPTAAVVVPVDRPIMPPVVGGAGFEEHLVEVLREHAVLAWGAGVGARAPSGAGGVREAGSRAWWDGRAVHASCGAGHAAAVELVPVVV
jgi:hypothetical protein